MRELTLSRAARRVIGVCLPGGLVLAAACTASNPAFSLDQAQGPDQAVIVDGGGGAEPITQLPDVRPHRDVLPWPDNRPWQCSGPSDCDDKLDCTEETCTAQGQCKSTLKAGFCIIAGECIEANDTNPDNLCESCQPSKQTLAWSPGPDGIACAPDSLACTADVCKAGFCQHPPDPKSCFINGSCYASNQFNPLQGCQVCNPVLSQQAWSPVGDGGACASDGVTCTKDSCQAGTCLHDLAPGWCLIGGICRAEGYSAGGDPCRECVSKRSTSALTFVAGKPCTNIPWGQVGGMCWQNKCSGWAESFIDPKITLPGPTKITTALNGVAVMPNGDVWAAGEYSAITLGGLLVRVSAGIVPVVQLAPHRFTGIHYRLAVGDGGQAWYHDGLTFGAHAKLQTALAASNRQGVWGTKIGADEIFWITGFEGNGSSGMLRCTLGADAVGCEPQTVFQLNTQMGPVSGTPGAFTMGPAWALPSAADDDIYYFSGMTKTWSWTGPQGCQDLGTGGGTPCSDTPGDYRDLFASGAGDVWAVGSSGTLMRYNGVAWAKLSSVVPYQSSYGLDAVFSSPIDKLVTVAGHSASGTGRFVLLLNYNTDLQRWLGPVYVAIPNQNPNDEIRDIGGSGYSNLWMVGTRLIGQSTGNPHQVGWVLQLK